MNRISLQEMIANGSITIDELANAAELIERAKLVKDGIEACKKTILFPLGKKEVSVYDYTDHAGEYHSWGTCNIDGTFICSTTWGGDHVIGKVNLFDFQKVYMAFEMEEFAHDLERFLTQQIEKAKKQ